MEEIIFNQFLNKEGDNFLGMYHIQNNYLYYTNILVAHYGDKIELNTTLSIKDILYKFLHFLKNKDIELSKLTFYINSNLFETYYEVLTNYAYYYNNEKYKKNYDLMELLLFDSEELKEEKTLNKALNHLISTDVKGTSIIRKLKIRKLFI